MITKDNIERLATRFQTNEQNVVNEYFQHIFLSYFYRNKNSLDILFKGGTALRIIYLSPRFSEDLDFSAKNIEVNKIEESLLSTINLIEKEGIIVDLNEAKETSGGYLGIMKFTDGDYTSGIQIEISLRNENVNSQIITISSDFTTAYLISSLTQSEIVDEKIQALLTRGKPRDFYDLYFMIRTNLLSKDQKKLFEQVKERLEKTDIDFEKELKTFLPKTHWPIIRGFKIER